MNRRTFISDVADTPEANRAFWRGLAALQDALALPAMEGLDRRLEEYGLEFLYRCVGLCHGAQAYLSLRSRRLTPDFWIPVSVEWRADGASCAEAAEVITRMVLETRAPRP